jgi:type IV secretion system protein VirD4
MKVDFIVDEAAFVGPMDAITNALNWGRGYGVSLTLVYQTMAQAEKCFPQGQHQTVLANSCQVLFGVNDNQTADYVSTRLGDQTIVVRDEGANTGSSSGHNEGGRDSSRNRGSSSGSSVNFKQHQRRLLKPEEILAMPRRNAIVLVPGMPPICTTLLRYYEEKWMTKRNPLREKLTDLVKYVRAGLMCLILVGVAIALTPGAFRALHVLMGK